MAIKAPQHRTTEGVNAGGEAINYPAKNIYTRVAEGAIPFGVGVVRSATPGAVKRPSGASLVFEGVARESVEASDLDNSSYSDGDPVGVMDVGIPAVYVEEAVDQNSPVRMRHTEDKTAGYQAWGFSSAKTGASASGLANDATAYTASIVVDGVAKAISIVGSAAQTLANVITQINTDLGAAATAALVDGAIRVTSATTGAASSVVITDTDLFGSLTDSNASAEDAVAGTDSGSATKQCGYFCTTAVPGQTVLLTGVRFRGKTTGAGVVPLELKGIFTVTADV